MDFAILLLPVAIGPNRGQFSDRSLLRDVAQAIKRDPLRHWIDPDAGGSSAVAGEPCASWAVELPTFPRVAIAISRAAAASSSMDRGAWLALKNLISDAPSVSHRHAVHASYAAFLYELEIPLERLFTQTVHSWMNSASTIFERQEVTRALIQPIR